MFNRIQVLVYLSVLCAQLSAQELTAIDSLPIEATSLSIDPQGNLFVRHKTEIALYTPDGAKTYRWSNPACGEGIQTDATDPFRIVAFCPATGMVYLFDNRLAPIGTALDLFAAGFSDPAGVCTSLQGGLWVFDFQSAGLAYLQGTGTSPARALNLRQWAEIASYPLLMAETDRYLVLAFADAGVLLFDHLGNFVRKAPIAISGKCAVGNNYFFYTQNDQLNQMNLNDFSLTNYKMPPTGTIYDMEIGKNQVYLVLEKTIQVFRLN